MPYAASCCSLQATAVSVVAAAAAAGELAAAAAAVDPSSLVKTLKVREAPAGSSGISGHVVLKMPPELQYKSVQAQLSSAPQVQAVVANRVVRITQSKLQQLLCRT
jgi:prolyl-tRNA editing enzyme YbaK/EbsC (Cys-tRNA(Pro) deacylase)